MDMQAGMCTQLHDLHFPNHATGRQSSQPEANRKPTGSQPEANWMPTECQPDEWQRQQTATDARHPEMTSKVPDQQPNQQMMQQPNQQMKESNLQRPNQQMKGSSYISSQQQIKGSS